MRAFGARLSAIVLVAVGLRVFYALRYAPDLDWGDGTTYHWLANLLADGRGFIGAQEYHLLGEEEPTTDTLPLYPFLLAAFSKLGLTSWTAHRLVSCALGGATVAAVGFLGRRIGGARAGLLAAAIAAIYPMLIIPQGMIDNEALFGLLITLTLIAALRLIDRPSPLRAATLGAAIGLSALTRGEALLLLPLLALPVVLIARERRWRNLGVASAALVLVVAPWSVRSSLVADRPVAISTNTGALLAGANCDAVYHGASAGLWTPSCWPPERPGEDSGDRAARFHRKGIAYVGDNLGRVPVVVGVRVLRVWSLYKPNQLAIYDRIVHGRHARIQKLGTRIFYVLLALALLGAVALRGRRAPLVVLLAPVILVTVTAALAFGTPRYRMAAEIPLVVLAAVGLLALRERAATRLSRARTR